MIIWTKLTEIIFWKKFVQLLITTLGKSRKLGSFDIRNRNKPFGRVRSLWFNSSKRALVLKNVIRHQFFSVLKLKALCSPWPGRPARAAVSLYRNLAIETFLAVKTDTNKYFWLLLANGFQFIRLRWRLIDFHWGLLKNHFLCRTERLFRLIFAHRRHFSGRGVKWCELI